MQGKICAQYISPCMDVWLSNGFCLISGLGKETIVILVQSQDFKRLHLFLPILLNFGDPPWEGCTLTSCWSKDNVKKYGAYLNGTQNLKPKPTDCRPETEASLPNPQTNEKERTLLGCFLMQCYFNKNWVIELGKQNHVMLVLHIKRKFRQE